MRLSVSMTKSTAQVMEESSVTTEVSSHTVTKIQHKNSINEHTGVKQSHNETTNKKALNKSICLCLNKLYPLFIKTKFSR